MSPKSVVTMMKEEAIKHLSQVEGWILVGERIEKDYKFLNFKQAISFINKVADVAESENHHPDILLWSWNHVKVTLTTHAVKGLSLKDFSLASKIDQIEL